MANASYILTPTEPKNRHASIDILRGVAVLGMVFMTIQAFAMPMAAYINPTVYENLTNNDLYVWIVSHVFTDGKFEAIFVMLFGASMVMLSQKARKEHLRSSDLQNKRLIYLGVFGILHAYLLWYGDVLLSLAITGLLMFIFRRKKSSTQIRAAVIFLIIGSAISLVLGYSVPVWEPGEYEANRTEIWQPDATDISEEIDYYTSPWERQILYRAPQAFDNQTSQFVFQRFWKYAGMMLIGMALYRRKAFKAKQSNRFYLKMVGYGLGLGLPLVAVGTMLNFNFEWDFRLSYFFLSQLNYWGSILMALGYIGIVMLFCKSSTRSFLAKRLAEVGRMALSNYILISLICSFVFYGQGLALFGDVDRSLQAVFVLGIWVFITSVSAIWLSYFKYGPFEWLWRTLTYGKLQSMAKD
ncbi:DUF418 domain-containing protein [Roseivirga sp.]|uniref:DUF418 domain-containing protein n=1 Tax=Roseivirga sp. TaxID=1964215 RepID=UPI003B525F42